VRVAVHGRAGRNRAAEKSNLAACLGHNSSTCPLVVMLGQDLLRSLLRFCFQSENQRQIPSRNFKNSQKVGVKRIRPGRTRPEVRITRVRFFLQPLSEQAFAFLEARQQLAELDRVLL
jgi:hypothetical protein